MNGYKEDSNDRNAKWNIFLELSMTSKLSKNMYDRFTLMS